MYNLREFFRSFIGFIHMKNIHKTFIAAALLTTLAGGVHAQSTYGDPSLPAPVMGGSRVDPMNDQVPGMPSYGASRRQAVTDLPPGVQRYYDLCPGGTGARVDFCAPGATYDAANNIITRGGGNEVLDPNSRQTWYQMSGDKNNIGGSHKPADAFRLDNVPERTFRDLLRFIPTEAANAMVDVREWNRNGGSRQQQQLCADPRTGAVVVCRPDNRGNERYRQDQQYRDQPDRSYPGANQRYDQYNR